MNLQLTRAKMQPRKWDDVQVFLALARPGSHNKAARALGVDPTTVGRRLAALEDTLGTRLFDRTPLRLVATPAALAILPRAERVEAELHAVEREASGADARIAGPIRITAGDGTINFIVAPALVELRRAHPGLEIVLRGDVRTLDLSRREADIALRLIHPKQPALIAKKLGAMQFGIYAARSYLDHHGTPRTLADTVAHPWIGFEADLDHVPQTRGLHRAIGVPRYVLRANATATHLAACAAGHGLALLPTFVARRSPELVQVAPRTPGPSRDLWAVTHSQLRGNARVAQVMRWLADVVAREL